MGARIRLTLFVLVCFLFFVRSATAQSSPLTSPPLQQTPQIPPSNTKILPPAAPQVPLLANQAGSTNERTINPQELREWIGALQNPKNGLAMNVDRFSAGPDGPNCGHIIIYQAPKMDSGIVLEALPEESGDVAMLQGLPPCRRDLRAPMTAQRFYGAPPLLHFQPRRPFVQPPASTLPSAQPRPEQPKTDAPGAKP